MGEQPANGDVGFALLGEFGPVARDGGIEVHLAAVDEEEQAGGGERLGDGIDVDQRILLPGSTRLGIGDAAPEVDYRPAIQVDAGCRAGVAEVFEAAFECLAGGEEARVAVAVNRGSHGRRL